MKLTAINKRNMVHHERTARTKMVIGTNILGCIAFLILMLLFNLGHADPYYYDQDTSSNSNRYQSKSRVSYSYGGSGKRWTRKNGFHSMDIQYRGDIVVNDTDTDIVSISPGGYLRIKKTTFGNTRSIVIESNSRGELTREYYEGRKNVGFNEDGRRWLADVLLEVVRHTGIGADARAARFYKSGGTNAVLNEIRQIDSNSGKGRYFRSLLGLCSQKDMPLVAEKIGSYISSNSVRGELFREYGDKFMATSESSQAFFDGVSYMTSNTERSRVLRNILRRHQLDPKGMVGLLKVARRMTSNTERGAVLREVNEQFPKSEEAVEAYFDVIASMTSNTEKGSVLRDLLRENGDTDQIMEKVLESVERYFTSNTEMGSVLRAAVPRIGDNEKLLRLYFQAVNRMTSNTEMGNALFNLLNAREVKTVEAQVGLLNCLRRMTSNTERSRVLRNCVDFLGKNNEVDDAFFDAFATMTSNTEKGHILRTVINRTRPDKDLSIRVLDATRYLTSNTEIGNVMVTLSRVMPKNDEKVKDAYRNAARRLSSNTEYRRVIEQLNK